MLMFGRRDRNELEPSQAGTDYHVAHSKAGEGRNECASSKLVKVAII